MTQKIVSFDPDAKSSEVAATLRRDGAVIARRAVSPEAMDATLSALGPQLAEVEPGGGEFYGNRTKTLGNLYALGREASEHFLTNQTLLEVLDGTLLPQRPMGLPDPGEPNASDGTGNAGSFDLADGLTQPKRDPVNGPNCHHYRVHSAGVIEVWPDGKSQPLHREMDVFRPFIEQEPDQPDYVVNVILAGTDFTAENGGTRIVVGSHQWPAERLPDDSEATQAEMPRGSILFWLGRTYHSLGVNRSDAERTGISTNFVVDWLAQEENQYLSVPVEIARTLPEKAQQLLGYRAGMLGWSTGRDSENLLQSGPGGPF